MSLAIQIQNLGKNYKLANSQRYLALRDVLGTKIKSLFSGRSNQYHFFWALRDINLDINEGERLGIIGRNGAGKSTLLKIISRVTPPTTGNIRIRGIVNSLLEIGTGFHPELSGRENIYLNGSILGLKKKDIDRQLDSIIQFSGIETFIDSPLKHYSSGMHLRLAFSVAAFLEPDILVIDEILAVGDAEFQKKCLARMEEVGSQKGRTILFVSHQMNFISRLCTRVIWLDHGKIAFDGPPEQAIEKYAQSVREPELRTRFERSATNDKHVFLFAEVGESKIGIGDDLHIRIGINNSFSNRPLVLNINILDQFGELVSHILNEDAGFTSTHLDGRAIHITLKDLNLLPGRYSLSFWAGFDMMHTVDQLEQLLSFEIDEKNNFTRRMLPFPSHSKIIIRSLWETASKD